jgi:hypothetical protein
MRKILLSAIFILTVISIYPQHSDTLNMERKPLNEVFIEYQDSLLSIPGAQGFYESIMENGEKCIVIMIESDTESIRKNIPDSLEGYPVKLNVTGKIKPMGKNRSPEK